jgi:hypothetical protein
MFSRYSFGLFRFGFDPAGNVFPDGCHDAGERFVMDAPTEAGHQTAARDQRDRVIPLRKSDIIDGLIVEGRLDEADQTKFRQLARMLGAILHYDYLEELDRLRETYFYFDPEIDPHEFGSAKDLDAAYQVLSDEFVRVLTDANFIEVSHAEITKAFAEGARVRVKIKAPVEDYRDVRMFRRGHHMETIKVPAWFGLRRRPLEIMVYDDVVLMVATKPDGMTPDEARRALSSARRGGQKVRSGAVLFKYFRHIARADLKALFPNVRVVRSLIDHLMLGVPAILGGVPILIKLASTMTVLFLVAGFYLGLSGTIHDKDMEQALAALSGLLALGAFMLRQWGNFHRQSLVHQKQLTDNVYYRNVNNNSGIFTYLIGEAEDQDWKEVLLAYYGLLTEAGPVTRDVLDARIEELLARMIGVSADFDVDHALSRLRGFDLVAETGSGFMAIPLSDALARLDREWKGLLGRPQADSQ